MGKQQRRSQQQAATESDNRIFRQIGSNWYATPNWHADEVMQYLTGNEWLILSAVNRKTLGWEDKKSNEPKQKEEDKISYSQFAEATGLSSSAISKAIEALRLYGLIIAATGRTGKSGRKYKLQLDKTKIDFAAMQQAAALRKEGGRRQTSPARTRRLELCIDEQEPIRAMPNTLPNRAKNTPIALTEEELNTLSGEELGELNTLSDREQNGGLCSVRQRHNRNALIDNCAAPQAPAQKTTIEKASLLCVTEGEGTRDAFSPSGETHANALASADAVRELRTAIKRRGIDGYDLFVFHEVNQPEALYEACKLVACNAQLVCTALDTIDSITRDTIVFEWLQMFNVSELEELDKYPVMSLADVAKLHDVLNYKRSQEAKRAQAVIAYDDTDSDDDDSVMYGDTDLHDEEYSDEELDQTPF